MNTRIQAALQDKENEIKINSCMFVSFKTTRIVVLKLLSLIRIPSEKGFCSNYREIRLVENKL